MRFTKVDSLPLRPRKTDPQLDKLREYMLDDMVPEARQEGRSIISIKLPNKKRVRTVQSTAQHLNPTPGNLKRKENECVTLDREGLRVTTRTRPIDGKDGEYLLYICVYQKEIDPFVD